MGGAWLLPLLLATACLGWSGARCEVDVDECAEPRCGPGRCHNTPGGYICECEAGSCGDECALPDPCYTLAVELGEGEEERGASGPCENGGECRQNCSSVPDYECHCAGGWAGRNCTEEGGAWGLGGGGGGGAWRAWAGVGGALAGVALAAAAGWLLAAQARRKRATRGTYSPSGQEYCNPRAEMMHHALKPPPEERLI